MKMRKAHCKTWNMVRNILKRFKMRNAHCWSWNMGINLKNVENEMKALYDLEYGEKP
jgi:hypothetical protein